MNGKKPGELVTSISPGNFGILRHTNTFPRLTIPFASANTRLIFSPSFFLFPLSYVLHTTRCCIAKVTPLNVREMS